MRSVDSADRSCLTAMCLLFVPKLTIDEQDEMGVLLEVCSSCAVIEGEVGA